MRRGVLLATLLALSGLSVTVHADDEPAAVTVAARHFEEGERAFAQGDFVHAGEAFEAAWRAAPHHAALWNAARSWHRALEPARAANLYRRYLEVAPAGSVDRDAAVQALAELGRELGRIEVVAPSATDVRVDDRPIAGSTWYVHAGSHLVSGTIDGERIAQEVVVDAGRTKSVALERRPAPVPLAPERPTPAPTAPAPLDSQGGVSPWWLAPLAGLTAISGAVTVGSGIDTLVARGQYLDLPPEERTSDLFAQGKLKQDRTNVALGITAGLALVTGAVAVFAVDWGGGTLVGLGPSGAELRGTF